LQALSFCAEEELFSEYLRGGLARPAKFGQIASSLLSLRSRSVLPELSGRRIHNAAYRAALWIKGIAARNAELTGRTANGNILVCP
jgi:hypothetical protein